MPKWVVVIIRRPNSDPWTQSEPFKALWLTLKTMVNEKRDIGLFVAIFGFCHITINYLHFSATGWFNILKIMTYHA